MKAALSLLLLASPDAGVSHFSYVTTSDVQFIRSMEQPLYFEQGPVSCGNHAKPRFEERDGGTWIVCDARKGR